MTIDALQMIDIIEDMQHFMEKRRPDEDIRHELDLDYRIEGQSIFIYSIRPRWDKPSVLMHLDDAKITFVKSSNEWRLFWPRANLKWERYEPKRQFKSLAKALEEIDADEFGCFWG